MNSDRDDGKQNFTTVYKFLFVCSNKALVMTLKYLFGEHAYFNWSIAFLAFEEETDEPSGVIAVPGIEGRIFHISPDMKEHLHQLRTARQQGLRTFSTISDDAHENSDSD